MLHFFGIGALVILLSLWIALLFLFCLGLMNGHLRERRQTFGAPQQLNPEHLAILERVELKLDAAIARHVDFHA